MVALLTAAAALLAAQTQAGRHPIVPADAGTTLPDLGPMRLVAFVTDEGTWMNLDVSPDGRTIAFELLGSIYTVPIGGGRTRQLTMGPAFDEHPQYSPDGRFIVFSSDRGGPVKLWRVPARGGVPALVPPSDTAGFTVMPELDVFAMLPSVDTGTVWSPDGHVGVRSSKPVGDMMPTKDRFGDGCIDTMPKVFLLVDRVSGRETTLASAGRDCGDDVMPRSAFTPDGRAFVTSYGGKLRRIEVPSGRMTVIPFQAHVRVRVRPLVIFSHPISQDPVVHARRIEHAVLSPDGTRVAFGALNHIWVMGMPATSRAPAHADTPAVQRPQRLTSLRAGEFEPIWSPDGQYIAFVTWVDTSGGAGAIYRMRADGAGVPERLTLEPGYYSHPAYTPDGTRVVATLRPARTLRRVGGADLWGLSNDAEFVWISATGGAADSIANVSPSQEVAGWGLVGYGTPYFGVEFPRRALRFQPDARGASHANTGAVLSVGIDDRLGGADTVLRVAMLMRTNRNTDPVDPIYGEPVIDDVVLSPNGNHALVLANGRALYLADIPPRQAGRIPTVTIDERTTQWRAISSLADGAEFPNWCADGRSFTYSFGHTFYVYDLGRADSLIRDSVARAAAGNAIAGPAYVPIAIPVDVTAPRDLPTGTVAFRNARLITMRGDEVIGRGDVVVRDRRILAVGPSGTVAIPADAHVVDVSGTTIMPGLVDLHDHIWPAPTIHRTRVWPFEASLAYGVLTVRDPLAPSLPDFMTYEDLLATGELVGPRYRNTGPGIGAVTSTSIQSIADARALMERYADHYQVQFLKEYMAGSRDAREWLVVAAAERRLNVTSHGTRRLKQLLSNVMDGYGGYEHPVATAPLYADVRKLLVVTGITLAHSNWSGFHSYFMETLDATDTLKLRNWWPPNAQTRELGTGGMSGAAEVRTYATWKMDSTLARLVADGGRIGVSDHGDRPGLGTHLQLWAYVRGGMPPLDALRAATLRGYQALGLDGDLGSLQVGKLADLVVLNGNPLEDIHNTIRLRYVLLNGRLYDAATLEELWPTPHVIPPPWWRAPMSASTTVSMRRVSTLTAVIPSSP